MTRYKSPPNAPLLSLSFAFLLAGLVACSPASQGEQAKGQATQPKPAQGKAAPAQPVPAPAPQGQPGAAAAPAAEAAPLDVAKLPDVVAKVNGQPINKKDMVKEAQMMQGQLAQAGRQEALNAAFYHQVLDGIIGRTLLLQEATAQGVVVKDEEAKQQIDGLRSRFPDADTFNKALAAQGMSEPELLAEARKQILVRKYVDAKIAPAINVTDEAAKTFYEQNKDQMKRPERAHLRHILIKADADAPAADKQKARAKAEEILAKLKAGGDFAKLASESSDDPGSKGQGGDLNWVARGQTVPAFEEAAFKLKANELSPVVETRFGYHVIQLLERQDASVVPFEEAKPRIAAFLKQRQMQEAVRTRVQELRTKGKVETFI
jgi:peptidyl-prolyl cis-trans isomerase C